MARWAEEPHSSMSKVRSLARSAWATPPQTYLAVRSVLALGKRTLMIRGPRQKGVSDGPLGRFVGSDTDGFFDWVNENFSVSDFSGFRCVDDS
jgi:hypothetical protein